MQHSVQHGAPAAERNFHSRYTQERGSLGEPLITLILRRLQWQWTCQCQCRTEEAATVATTAAAAAAAAATDTTST